MMSEPSLLYSLSFLFVRSSSLAAGARVLRRSRGKLPAEHGHGTEYVAPEATRRRWQEMDPLNVFNPGVGGLSVKRRYGKA